MTFPYPRKLRVKCEGKLISEIIMIYSFDLLWNSPQFSIFCLQRMSVWLPCIRLVWLLIVLETLKNTDISSLLYVIFFFFKFHNLNCFIIMYYSYNAQNPHYWAHGAFFFFFFLSVKYFFYCLWVCVRKNKLIIRIDA